MVKNAIQAIPEDRTAAIKVELSEEAHHIFIKVKDNGSGIENGIRQKIFEPKFTTKTSGMGLGLPMVKNIVEAYNGEITFNTTLNKGTVFVVSFPKKQ